MNTPTPPRFVVFDPPSEIFATDSAGGIHFPLMVDGDARLESGSYDEVRFLCSIWHPSEKRTIDLDRAYVELRASFDLEDDHWTRLAEIEPIVPAYGGGTTFDGWIVLPILADTCAYALYGSGFEPRSRLQVRASAYFVA